MSYAKIWLQSFSVGVVLFMFGVLFFFSGIREILEFFKFSIDGVFWWLYVGVFWCLYASWVLLSIAIPVYIAKVHKPFIGFTMFLLFTVPQLAFVYGSLTGGFD